jgi:pimeloyl-ACP methyl ester carboxylesterase
MDVSEVPPDYGRAPFPTDAVMDGLHIGQLHGLEKMTPGQPDLIGAHLATLDGWGLRPVVEFFIDGEIDGESVLGGIEVVDVDPNSPLRGSTYAIDAQWDGVRHVIAGSPHPGVQLVEGTRYAAALATSVHGAGRAQLYAPGMDLVLHATPARWATTAAAFAELDARDELHGKIAALAVFTTEHASDTLVQARGELAGMPAPPLAFDDAAIIFDSPAKLDQLLGQATRDGTGMEVWGLDNPTGLAHDHVAVVATGTTTSIRFKTADDGTFGPTSKTFQVGAGGAPIVQGTDTIPITFVLPNTPMPAAGYPVIIFGHGLGGSRVEALYQAEPLTSQGYAIVAIDMWGHGTRYDPTDGMNNFAAGKPGFTGDAMLRDGFGDNTGYAEYIAFFENFLNVSAIRDSIRQSALDFSRVATLIQSRPNLDAIRVGAKLDPTRVAYMGQSFGTLVGSDLSAIEPSVDLFILNVPGGGILDQIVPYSPTIGSLALPIAQEIYRTDGTLDRFHPLLGAMQAVLDGADPLTFAPHVFLDRFRVAGTVLGPRHVVCIEAVGDEIMSNQGTAALARAYRMAVLKPDLDPPETMAQLPAPALANLDGQTAILVQYAPATHGYNWSAQHGELDYEPGFPHDGDMPFPKLATPIPIQEPLYATQAQVAHILATHFISGGPPEVISTETPVPY